MNLVVCNRLLLLLNYFLTDLVTKITVKYMTKSVPLLLGPGWSANWEIKVSMPWLCFPKSQTCDW